MFGDIRLNQTLWLNVLEPIGWPVKAYRRNFKPNLVTTATGL
jgi:hypothetical protein